MELLWIDSVAQLSQKCQDWQSCRVLALDTEFVRTRSFYPQLGLIQVFDGQQVTLIDALAIDDWREFADLLARPDLIKVLHACSEDIEIFYHLTGCAGLGIVDTQILAAFVGLGSSLGFAPLLKLLLNQDLAKGESRSDWLKRPLSDAQIRYAADDVFWLLPLYQQLERQFGDCPQWQWALADSQALADPARFQHNDPMAYLKIKLAWQLKPMQLAVLQNLAAWREQEARAKDTARNFVITEQALLALSRKMPQQLHELARITELTPVEIRRYGAQLLEQIEQARQRPPEHLPPPVERLIDWPGYKELYGRCQQQVVELARENQLTPELLASRKLIDRFIRRHRRGLPSPLSGWRERLMEASLRDCCDEA